MHREGNVKGHKSYWTKQVNYKIPYFKAHKVNDIEDSLRLQEKINK
jgi:hypothetical protein